VTADRIALRRSFARRMMAIARVTDAAVEQALATVPREAFLGDGPWTILDPRRGTADLAGTDPARIYEDVLVVLDPARGLNNGSPSLHALMLHHLAVRPGDRVLHVGAGTGYYSAILADLAGPDGRVTAIEFEPRLAAIAAAALTPWPQVTAVEGDGAAWPIEEVDRIYVNFAAALPAAAWIDHLAPGGTLVFPLGTPNPGARGDARRQSDQGAVLAFTRTPAGIAARHLTRCAFVCAEGSLAGTPSLQESLHRAFVRGGVEFVQSFHRPPPASPERCWFWSPDWALSYDDLPAAPASTA
jgi:protein-L-isoaspartate(D-aspartate) O-methyltransferase